MYPRTEMLDLVVIDGRARGIVVRDMVTGRIESHVGRRRGPRHRRLRQRVLPLDQREGLERHGDLAGAQARRRVRQPVLHPDPSDLHPGERRLSVQAHADERVAPERRAGLGAQARGRRPAPGPDPRERARLLPRAALSRASATWRPRDIASRAAKAVCDEGRGVGPGGLGVYLDFADAISRLGAGTIRERYGNLFEMYQRITDEDPYRVPMRIFPAVHYTMGGLWVDYNLMSTDPGAARDRRGQLLRSRRQPPRRERPHAGARRRLLHPAEHDRRLPGRGQTGARGRLASGIPPGRGRGGRAHAGRCSSIAGQADGGLVPPRARPAHVGPVRHGPERGRPPEGARADSRAARGVLAQRERAGQRRASSTRRWRRPGASPTSWSSASSCAGTRSTGRSRAAATSARNTRPRMARPGGTTSSSPMRRPGNTPGDLCRAPAPQGAARVRVRAPGPAELQVNVTLHVWRQASPTAPRAHGAVRGRATSARTCRFSRCSTSSMSG